MEEKMKDYTEIIELLENIIANNLDVNSDYEVTEIINRTIDEIQHLS